MNSITPQDLLDLKSRIDLWRSTRRFIRQPIPDHIRLAIVQAASRHSPSLVKKVLQLDPYRFKPAPSSRKVITHGVRRAGMEELLTPSN